MIDLTKKANFIPTNSIKCFDKETIKHMQENERSALIVCGGLLGDCYIMMEVIDWMLSPNGGKILQSIKSQKWFKQEIKYHINKAVDNLRKSIYTCKYDSLTNSEFMQEIGDQMYDRLKLDLFKLKNSIFLFIGTKVKNAEVVADFFTIDMLLQWIVMDYNRVINKMQTELYPIPDLPEFYDSWYKNIKNEGAANNWAIAVDKFGEKYLEETIDLNESPLIKAGIHAIDRIIKDPNIAVEFRKNALTWTEEGKGSEEYFKALNILEGKKTS